MIVVLRQNGWRKLKFMVKVQRAKEYINLMKKYRREYDEYN
ncbi:MAG: hypothetical protein U9R12_05555 [Candidatus Caldatribacteriota bacterium]|nr:hypothetical protein [Candidatus Caldatribacteriota bacterium]